VTDLLHGAETSHLRADNPTFWLRRGVCNICNERITIGLFTLKRRLRQATIAGHACTESGFRTDGPTVNSEPLDCSMFFPSIKKATLSVLDFPCVISAQAANVAASIVRARLRHKRQ
jgi:hypothetical protein